MDIFIKIYIKKWNGKKQRWVSRLSHLSLWFVWFHQLHRLTSLHHHDLWVTQPGHIQRATLQKGHDPCGATAHFLFQRYGCIHCQYKKGWYEHLNVWIWLWGRNSLHVMPSVWSAHLSVCRRDAEPLQGLDWTFLVWPGWRAGDWRRR